MFGYLSSIFLISILSTSLGYETQSEAADYWNKVSAEELNRILKKTKIDHRAKNIILFVGDGMSIPTVTAARIFKAQKEKDKHPGFQKLLFEESPFIGLSKTYSNNQMVADSASTATALLSDDDEDCFFASFLRASVKAQLALMNPLRQLMAMPMSMRAVVD